MFFAVYKIFTISTSHYRQYQKINIFKEINFLTVLITFNYYNKQWGILITDTTSCTCKLLSNIWHRIHFELGKLVKSWSKGCMLNFRSRGLWLDTWSWRLVIFVLFQWACVCYLSSGTSTLTRCYGSPTICNMCGLGTVSSDKVITEKWCYSTRYLILFIVI